MHFTDVLPVFNNVEPKDVRHQSGPHYVAFKNHGIRFKDDMKRVCEYKTALGQLAEFRGLFEQRRWVRLSVQLHSFFLSVFLHLEDFYGS